MGKLLTWCMVSCMALWFACARVNGQTCTDSIKNGAETDKDCGGSTCPKCLTAKACLVGTDCLSGVCTSGKCAEPVQCYNKVKDRRETDVDCGGGECYEACWVGKQCAATWDCKSGICTNGLCAEATTCKNGIKDGRETDIDCGGGACYAICSKGQKCGDARDCSTASCVSGVCAQPTTCTNKVKDGSETDIDCGGLCDLDCPVTGTCKANSDCLSNVCSGGVCVDASTCKNGIKEAKETDVDCGGGGCTAVCDKGKKCATGSDCSTGTCTSGLCVQPATCTNKVKDSIEGDVDCGGYCDKQCGVSATCRVNGDCISNVCNSGKCLDAPTCSNGVKDAKETDVDCGGGGCGVACDVGQTCSTTWDCKTKLCTNGVCQPLATCTNGVWDTTTEGAQDCGQLCSNQCGTGKTCRLNGDCISNVCSGGMCVDAPTCNNKKKDGTETDVDCGGGGCSAACYPQQKCASSWDCKTKLCSNGVCQQLTTCTNGVLDSTEGAIDCGQMCNNQCGTGKTCKANDDCISDVCSSTGTCTDAPTCTNKVKDGSETDIDCGGGGCSKPCVPGQRCASSWDCDSSNCTSSICQAPPAPTCTDGIRNGKESDVDCGGPDCPPCLGQRLCWSNSDCASSECNF